MKIFYHIAGYAAGILALSLSVASCSREAAVPDEMGELEIEGKIYDYDLDSSDDGVEGMVVVLSAFGDDDGYCYDIGRDTTDASGFFSMRTVSKIEGRKFRLRHYCVLLKLALQMMWRFRSIMVQEVNWNQLVH